MKTDTAEGHEAVPGGDAVAREQAAREAYSQALGEFEQCDCPRVDDCEHYRTATTYGVAWDAARAALAAGEQP